MNASFDIRPDWSKQMKKCVLDLDDCLQFIGPGWYTTETDTMLVMPVDRTIDTCWNMKSPSIDPENELFMIYIWNHTNVHNSINLLISAPERVGMKHVYKLLED